MIVIDARNCLDLKNTVNFIEDLSSRARVNIDFTVYSGLNPVWGGIRWLNGDVEYVLIQGDDELPARMKLRYLERYIRRLRDSILQLPVFERTTIPRIKPKVVIGQVNFHGITSNFDALPPRASRPFQIHNLASNRVMPLYLASKYNLEDIKLIGGYGVETHLAFQLIEDGVNLYYVPKIEVANMHLQAERPHWRGPITHGNPFKSASELMRLIREVSRGNLHERSYHQKSLLRLANYLYIAWRFNRRQLAHHILRNFVYGRHYYRGLNVHERMEIIVRARQLVVREYGLLDLTALIDHYICLLYTSPSPRDLSTSRMPSSA